MEATTAAPKPKRHRSPSYPAFDLKTALGRAEQLYKVAGRHGVPIPAALDAWKFTAKSSNGSLTIAALKRFGLANDEGKRGARQLVLTSLGHELLVYSDRGSEEWKSRIQKAALTPTIHADLWAKYDGDLPQDSVIRPYLVIERGFSDSAADELLREFRSTIDFAGLVAGDRIDTLSEEEDGEDKGEPAMTAPATISSKGAAPPSKAPAVEKGSAPGSTPRTIQIPYSPSGWALLQAEFPMTDASWARMLSVLEAMKPSLVDSDGE